jgi:hypothetical protein
VSTRLYELDGLVIGRERQPALNVVEHRHSERRRSLRMPKQRRLAEKRPSLKAMGPNAAESDRHSLQWRDETTGKATHSHSHSHLLLCLHLLLILCLPHTVGDKFCEPEGCTVSDKAVAQQFTTATMAHRSLHSQRCWFVRYPRVLYVLHMRSQRVQSSAVQCPLRLTRMRRKWPIGGISECAVSDRAADSCAVLKQY